MSRRRRRRRGNQGGGRGQQDRSRNRNNQRNRSRSAGSGSNGQQKSDSPGFWGDPSNLPDSPEGIKVTDDAHAVPRSLGEPPLPQKREVAEHYFAAIYDRAIQTAGALAAAGGLIDFEDLTPHADEE